MLKELLENNKKIAWFDKCIEKCDGKVIEMRSNGYAVDIYGSIGYDGINVIELHENVLSLRGGVEDDGTIDKVTFKCEKDINIHDDLKFNNCFFNTNKNVMIGEFYRTFSFAGNRDKFKPVSMDNCYIDADSVYFSNFTLKGDDNLINANKIHIYLDCDFPNETTKVIERLLGTNVFLSPYCWEHGNALRNIEDFNSLDWDKLLGFNATTQNDVYIAYTHNGGGDGWKERYRENFHISNEKKGKNDVKVGNMWITK